VRSDPDPEAASYFLGVRLGPEEVRRLDRIVATRGLSNRSEAIRALLRDADERATSGGAVPPTIEAQLEDLVEDGWFGDVQGALTALMTSGLRDFARLHGEDLPALKRAARDVNERRRARRRWNREGRGLLER
jgi:hypothetical protein